MHIRSNIALTISFVLLLSLLLSSPASPQYYFGKNKVQYTHFDWRVLATEHFDVYFYPEEREVAEAGASYAEDCYRQLSSVFGIVIDKKIPFIVYSSPAYFTQTNVVPGLLPEGVGGFTEFMKERVVVPFSGSHDRFRRVIKHELVHVFTFHKLYETAELHHKRKIASPPLWFIEGIAEYYSQRSDAPEVAMMVGDYYLSGRPISLYDMYYFGSSYPIYKLGQAFCRFVDETYGQGKINLLFENWHKGKDFEQILSITLNEPFEEINRKWMYSQKKKYYPLLSSGDLPGYVSRKLTHKGYNLKPTIYMNSLGQEWVIFKANRMGYSSIYGMRLGMPGVQETYIKGERSSDYESLHLMESSISVSSDGLLAFVSKRNERDIINIYDIEHKRGIRKLSFDSLVRIYSPHWSSDGYRLVFSGTGKSGNEDLYTCDKYGEELIELTDDHYLDSSPKFSPDGRYIAFTSDRGIQGQSGRPGLYLYDLESDLIYTIIDDGDGYYSPSWSRGGDSLVFIRDCEGTTNIFMLSGIRSGDIAIHRITDFPTGAFDPVFADSSGGIVFSAYSEGAFHLYHLIPDNFVEEDQVDSTMISEYFSSWEPPRLDGELRKGVVDYKTKYSIDIGQSVMAYDAVVGPVGGLQLAFTDMLGNHQYYLVVSNTAGTSKEFGKKFSVALSYLNRTRRVNWGIGAYRFNNDYYNEFVGDYSERQTGVMGMLVYPFGKFRRMELSLYLRRYEKEYALFEDTFKGLLFTPYLSYIIDTGLWEHTGPIDGMRINLTVGLSQNLEDGQTYSRMFLGDVRKYFRISTFSCFATRLFYITSAGKDPQRYYLGGSWSLRGYGFRAFYGRNVFLSSTELRFPLIDALLIGFPIGSFDFRAIRGAVFFDAGNAWDDDFARLHGSMGVGARVNLGSFVVLRFDYAHRTDFKKISRRSYFDFFFGWNF